MLFLIGFAWLVAASFAFVLAMLTPNWVTFTKTDSSGSLAVQRGIFYICDVLFSNQTHSTQRCVAMIDQTSTTDSQRWIYRKLTWMHFEYAYSIFYFSSRRTSEEHLLFFLHRICYCKCIIGNCMCWIEYYCYMVIRIVL